MFRPLLHQPSFMFFLPLFPSPANHYLLRTLNCLFHTSFEMLCCLFCKLFSTSLSLVGTLNSLSLLLIRFGLLGSLSISDSATTYFPSLLSNPPLCCLFLLLLSLICSFRLVLSELRFSCFFPRPGNLYLPHTLSCSLPAFFETFCCSFCQMFRHSLMIFRTSLMSFHTSLMIMIMVMMSFPPN